MKRIVQLQSKRAIHKQGFFIQTKEISPQTTSTLNASGDYVLTVA